MNIPRFATAGLILACALSAQALQPSNSGPFNPPANGPRHADSTWVAIADCTLHAAPGTTLEHATVVMRAGKITAVLPGEGAQPARTPIGPRVVPGAGLHVYAAFVDPFVEVDAPAPGAESPGRHWNENVTPQRDARQGAGIDPGTAESLRKIGFGTAAESPRGGIFRGWAAVVSLAKPSDDTSVDRPAVYAEHAYQTVGLTGSGGYPSSQMGSIALIRQTFSDADDHQAHYTPGRPRDCLDSLWKDQVEGRGDSPRYVYATDDELEALRVAKIAKEFHRSAIVLGSGTEFRRLDAIRADGLQFILPVSFPKAPDVSTPTKQDSVDLREMMTWEQAPTNPKRLAGAGVKFALTTAKLRDRGQFMGNLRKAIKAGLAEDAALAALTTTPAEMLGLADQVGRVAPGLRANLILADGPIFDAKTKLRAVYIDGQAHELDTPGTKLEGEWTIAVPGAPEASRKLVIDEDNGITVHLNDKSVKAGKVLVEGNRVSFTFDHEPLDGQVGVWVVSAALERTADAKPARLVGQGLRAGGESFGWTATRQPDSAALGRWRAFEADGTIRGENDAGAPTIVVRRDGITIRVGDKSAKAEKVKVEAAAVSYEYENKPFGEEGVWKDTATIEGDVMTGESVKPDGSKHTWKARRQPKDEPKKDDEDASLKGIPENLMLPFGPYGLEAMPAQGTIVFNDVTLWTGAADGIVEHASVLVAEGKIAGIANAPIPAPPGATVVDGKGRHLTAGIIDCHSHTGISKGVNEGGQAVTSEVRVEDVTNPDTTNWYWQLAGGVTAVNNLHGSANAIGGQSQTNKIRWGVSHPDQMHFEGAMPGIKFALGENPRRANGGGGRDGGASGPQRYPVTRMGVETLIRDRFTAAKEYAAARKGQNPPPRDLELDALAEILAGTRIVHCHSYRQDEIVMLCQVAKDFGFKIGTFQHILEGYKVADFVRDYSGGGSGFTDWWSYKMEVQDAIPGGLPLMHDVGCVMSFNSDSDELARRLNVEAAKAVKYGNLSPEEAWKFVTLNPAKQLHIDSRVGSVEVGKDADLALWSGPPMSAFTRCEMTLVDGRVLFSTELDAALRAANTKERARLIQKLLAEPKRAEGAGDRPGGPPGDRPRGGGRRRPPQEEEALRREYEDLLYRGKTPNEPGVCGCGLSHE